MSSKEKKTRNYNIDFLRGIATMCIILIHTAWWSGTAYLPKWFSNLTLLIDVPVFMFIAGVSFNYVNSIIKNLKGLLNQWKKWLYFLLFYVIILIAFFIEQFHVEDIISWVAYVFPHDNNISVVGGSIWFMIMYIKVTILCSIIICTVNYFCKKDRLKLLITISGIFLLSFLYCATGNNLLFLDSYISFYSLIYFLGYILHNYKIKNIKQLIILECVNFGILLIMFLCLGLNINDIQNIKFPPSTPYLPFALISILLFWYLKDHLHIKENNKINYIGQNAIFYYFSQGISSSFIYYVYQYIPFDNIVLKFICMLTCNVLLATIGAVFLDKSYQCLKNKINYKRLKNSIIPTKITEIDI